MKKIIFVANNNLGFGLSGGDRIFLEFLKNWQNKSEITLFACKETINLIKNYNIKNIKIVPTDTVINESENLTVFKLFKHTFRRTFIGIKFLIKNKKIIKNADIIYSVSDFYPDYFPALIAKIINPKIIWIAGFYLFIPNPFSKINPYKGKLLLKGFLYWLMQIPSFLLSKLFADTIFVTSKPDVSKFPNKKVVIIQGGVDIKPSEDYFKKNKLIKNKQYDAVFIGRLHPQKGVVELIDIWKEVCQKIPTAKLALIGNGQLLNDVQKKIKKNKLKNNIKLLGFLDGQEKYKIFKQSKIVVHPATYDSGGMAAAEAMAWGLPGVSFDLEALKTYYPNGMIKTKCFDKKNFSKNIINLLEDKKLYKKYSIEARKLIVQEWDWEKKCEKLYKQLF